MTDNLSTSLDRADELLRDLKAEYETCLRSRSVSPRAVQLTHDVCEKLRSVLDRVARFYWEKKVSPSISETDRTAAKIYFPIAKDSSTLDSILGRWRWKTVQQDHADVKAYLLSLQPFTSETNKWLKTLDELAQAGKHIDLVPQVRREERRITVTNQTGAAVSWNPSGLTFGSGVRVSGAPIDPTTQRIVPTPGVTERLETWVLFMIAEYDVDAAAFCSDACSKTRTIVNTMKSKFNLS